MNRRNTINQRICIAIAILTISGLIIASLVANKTVILKETTELKQELMTKPSPTDSYRIVVDEETLIQYIIFTNNTDNVNARIGGITVRIKPDGTPYTIDPKDLDKYEHFSFDNDTKQSTVQSELCTAKQ